MHDHGEVHLFINAYLKASQTMLFHSSLVIDPGLWREWSKFESNVTNLCRSVFSSIYLDVEVKGT